MNILKKLGILSLISTLSLPQIFASTFTDKIIVGLSSFATLYLSLTQNNNIMNGVAIIVLFFAMYLVFFNWTRYAFKDEGAKPARKGVSVILSILFTAALIRITPSELGFVGYYGGIITFVLVLALILFTYVRFINTVNKKYKKNNAMKYGLYSLGLIIIDITLSNLIVRLFESVSKPSIIHWLINNLSTIASFALLIAIIAIPIGLMSHNKKEKKKDEDEENSDNDEDDSDENEKGFFSSFLETDNSDDDNSDSSNSFKDIKNLKDDDKAKIKENFEQALHSLARYFENLSQNKMKDEDLKSFNQEIIQQLKNLNFENIKDKKKNSYFKELVDKVYSIEITPEESEAFNDSIKKLMKMISSDNKKTNPSVKDNKDIKLNNIHTIATILNKINQ